MARDTLIRREFALCETVVKLARNVCDKTQLIRFRGNSYENVTHDLQSVAERIVQSFAGEPEAGARSVLRRERFAGWVQSNPDLLEYLFNKVCPLQWVSQTTVQTRCFQKIVSILIA